MVDIYLLPSFLCCLVEFCSSPFFLSSFCFSSCSLMIFFCSIFEFLSFSFCKSIVGFIYGYHRGSRILAHNYIYLLQTDNHSSSNKFFKRFISPLPHILWFWCLGLHLHACLFTVCCSYNCFYIFLFSNLHTDSCDL